MQDPLHYLSTSTFEMQYFLVFSQFTEERQRGRDEVIPMLCTL